MFFGIKALPAPRLPSFLKWKLLTGLSDTSAGILGLVTTVVGRVLDEFGERL